jgi:hypothetical protein
MKARGRRYWEIVSQFAMIDCRSGGDKNVCLPWAERGSVSICKVNHKTKQNFSAKVIQQEGEERYGGTARYKNINAPR